MKKETPSSLKNDMYKAWVIFKYGLTGKLEKKKTVLTCVIPLNHKRRFEGTELSNREEDFKDYIENVKSLNQPTKHIDVHKYTYNTEWLKHIARKTTLATGSSNCRCQLPSVIKPEASACNHSILTPRHQSALQQYKPIINPQDVPTLKSFPSHPEADRSEWSHLSAP